MFRNSNKTLSFRSDEVLRKDQAEKERENWRKTLEQKCDKLAEDNKELKEDIREMKELLKRIVLQTTAVPRIESTYA